MCVRKFSLRFFHDFKKNLGSFDECKVKNVTVFILKYFKDILERAVIGLILKLMMWCIYEDHGILQLCYAVMESI